MKIAFIGGGNMAEAMISAILNKGLSSPKSITVSDIKEERLQHLKQTYRVNTSGDNRTASAGSDIVVFAIKPQNLDGVMSELKGHLTHAQLVLSIIAGARLGTIANGLNHCCVARAMPNTPAQIGDGMTVWTTTACIEQAQKKTVGSILEAMGKQIYVYDEDFIDKATAISGSGPAYVFLFAESLAEAAEKIGFPAKTAEELAIQTLAGATHLLQKSGEPPAELRRKVTSPGGTTAEAIARFEQGGFSKLVADAVNTAYEKAKTLGK